VAKVKDPGYFGDGGGLWLQVSKAGTKSWIFRFTLAGKAREMGLGPLHTVTLADARGKATECRRQLLEGVDPIEARNTRRLTATATAAKALTFDEAATKYIEANRAGWRNAKHGAQWQATLDTYASPVFGKLPVALVDTALVRQALDPIWTTKTETATRVRARIEAVISWADKIEDRERLNPARWKGHLDKLLANPRKVTKTEHHAALAHARIGAFMAALRAEKGTAARAVELIVLSACRTSEAFEAQRDEFDLTAKVWTIPAERTKSGRPHRVPLSRQAVKLVAGLDVEQGSVFVFPGAKEGRPLSNMAGLKLLQRMGLGDYTVHGFRSTFRDWAGEQTNFPRELAEAALAHVIKDRTEAAYARSDLLEKRARLMQAWADYCDRVATPAAVTPIGARQA
jgi:integrase